MPISIRNESLEFARFVKRNKNEILVVSLATLILILSRYHPVDDAWIRYLLYYLALPVLAIVVFLRKNPLDFGLRLGNYRLWGLHVVIACLVSLVLVYFSSHITSVKEYYSPTKTSLPYYVATKLVVLFSLEFFYRGFLIFGLKEKFKEGAILVQMVPYAILHIGKPEIEAIGCIASGIYFGYLVYRSNSCWPAFLIHVFVNVANKLINVL
jgi:membrane protease YdiL (CAAX protease family)